MKTKPHILIFKTSVFTRLDVACLTKLLNSLGSWTFDLEDEDHVLRIETIFSSQEIEQQLTQEGFECVLMPY
ncbi:hypothetical protein [Sphingobacterium suaedae]|uniref:Copper chaperone n=1 Tax=Sphingobacterium suaedae TaxID=1686402 RepID=A0ABW5KG46_9SPHI